MGNEILKEARLKKNLTQVKLGEMVGVTNHSIYSYENCKQKPSVKIARKLAKILGINLENLDCSKISTKKKTNEEFIKEVYELVGNEYTFLEEYNKAKSKILCRHNICEIEYKVTPDEFINQNRRCPKCNKRYKINNHIFKEIIFDLVEKEYTFLEKYNGSNNKILVRHNKCGNVYKVKPFKFISAGNRCPKCQHRSYKKTIEEIKKEIFDLVGDEYELVSDYVNNSTPIYLKHNECGNVYKTYSGSFLYKGVRCQKCGNVSSLAENEIEDFLNERNINYKSQYIDYDCRNPKTNYPLRFDFAVFNDDDDLCCLIEYDGIFHDSHIEGLNTKEELKKQQYRDGLKNNYCNNNDIELLRISRFERNNMIEILKENLEFLIN